MKSTILSLFIIILLVSGCTTNDKSDNHGVDRERSVKHVSVYLSSTEPTAIISDEQQVRSFLSIIEQAKPLPEGLAYTDDFFRTFTIDYTDGSTRTLSFNKGGGKVFSDSLDGKDYGIDEADKQQLQALVREAETK